MSKTTADEWFERYLLEHGFEPGAHEPDLSSWGVESRPDYVPTGQGGQIACEVKQFGTDSKLARRLAEQSYVAASDAEVFGPIRNQVAEAARQLKPLAARKIPLVAVLTNPDGAPVDLSFEHVLAALYGNPQWTVISEETFGETPAWSSHGSLVGVAEPSGSGSGGAEPEHQRGRVNEAREAAPCSAAGRWQARRGFREAQALMPRFNASALVSEATAP